MKYSVYGVRLDSAWDLPYPNTHGSSCLADVKLSHGRPHEFDKAHSLQQLQKAPALWSDQALPDGSTYLRWDGVFEFLIRPDGRQMLCRPVHDRAEEAFHTHLGPSLSFALINLGIEPLHSTTPVIDGGAVALMGNCGYGKSSLGASFVKAGFPLLTDDLLVIRPDVHGATAYPGAPRVKLFPEIARKIFGRRVSGLRLKWLTPKMIIPLSGSSAQSMPVPLKAIYVLTPPARRHPPKTLRIRKLSQRQAFVELVRNTFNMAVTDTGRLQRQLALASALAALVPVKSLSYPREFAMLSTARDAIIADVRRSQRAIDRNAQDLTRVDALERRRVG